MELSPASHHWCSLRDFFGEVASIEFSNYRSTLVSLREHLRSLDTKNPRLVR